MRPILLPTVLAILVAGCGTARPRRGEEGPPKAVVLCPPERREFAQELARRLSNEGGYDVVLDVTSIRRERSSAAVYGLMDHPDRLDEVTGFLEALGEGAAAIEILPFQQRATGGNALVVWLAAPPN